MIFYSAITLFYRIKNCRCYLQYTNSNMGFNWTPIYCTTCVCKTNKHDGDQAEQACRSSWPCVYAIFDRVEKCMCLFKLFLQISVFFCESVIS